MTYYFKMSFKDKPLKKIVADTRVTIDALHNDIVKDFDKEKQEYNENLKLKEQFETEYKENKSDEVLIKLNEVKKKIKGFKPEKETDYYLDTGMLLTICQRLTIIFYHLIQNII